jgi:hypothetical protein
MHNSENTEVFGSSSRYQISYKTNSAPNSLDSFSHVTRFSHTLDFNPDGWRTGKWRFWSARPNPNAPGQAASLPSPALPPTPAPSAAYHRSTHPSPENPPLGSILHLPNRHSHECSISISCNGRGHRLLPRRSPINHRLLRPSQSASFSLIPGRCEKRSMARSLARSQICYPIILCMISTMLHRQTPTAAAVLRDVLCKRTSRRERWWHCHHRSPLILAPLASAWSTCPAAYATRCRRRSPLASSDAPAFHSPPHHMSLTTVAFSPHAGKELCAACSVQNTYAHKVLNGWCFICL